MRWSRRQSRSHLWIGSHRLRHQGALRRSQLAPSTGTRAFGVASHVHAARGRGLATALGRTIAIHVYRAGGSSRRLSMSAVSNICMRGRASAR